jgi:hypothetical protein
VLILAANRRITGGASPRPLSSDLGFGVGARPGPLEHTGLVPLMFNSFDTN